MPTLIPTISLALLDSINPCALAIMTMVLVSILTADEQKKHRVLLGGLAFTSAIFVGYFFYGLIIIQLFKSFVQFTSVIYPYLIKILAILAILLGIFNLKDFIRYKPGGFATEMPLRIRPKVKQIIKRITSPKGAFFIGIFVTLFLLPCTAGPLVIFSGLISQIGIVKTIPWLILYNLIFIIPMVIITFIVYAGVSTTERVSAWKERNIKYLHLATGLILVILGILILTGILNRI
tara:strand:- start:4159 stop:4863 length:705 start_codon:yes stop_codon:yes gene_type:complete